MTEPRQPLCAVSLARGTPLPVFDIAVDGPLHGELAHSLGGLDVTVRDYGQTLCVSVVDAASATRVDWLVFRQGAPEGISTVNGRFPAPWNGVYRWNHITVSRDRTEPFMSFATCVSRNCWARTVIDPDLKGFTTSLAQLEPGPCHLAWISRQGGPFPIKSFKEIGAGETGGIKFRVDDLEYVMFHLEDAKPERAPEPVVTGTGLAVMRYRENELEGYWHITDRHARVWI